MSLPESVGAPLVGALRGLLWRPNLDAIALFSLPLRGQEGSKMFSVPLRGPPWTKKGFLRAPSRPFADKKGVLPAPSRAIVASQLRCVCPDPLASTAPNPEISLWACIRNGHRPEIPLCPSSSQLPHASFLTPPDPLACCEALCDNLCCCACTFHHPPSGRAAPVQPSRPPLRIAQCPAYSSCSHALHGSSCPLF